MADSISWNVSILESLPHKYPRIGQICKDIAVKTAEKSRTLASSTLPGVAPEMGPTAAMRRGGAPG
jgi:hypothetical protein